VWAIWLGGWPYLAPNDLVKAFEASSGSCQSQFEVPKMPFIAEPAPLAIRSETSGTTISNCLPFTCLSRMPNCTAWVSELTMSKP
jgi:hypothetical protein